MPVWQKDSLLRASPSDLVDGQLALVLSVWSLGSDKEGHIAAGRGRWELRAQAHPRKPPL